MDPRFQKPNRRRINECKLGKRFEKGTHRMPQVKVAILGCGGMAGAHARRLKGHPDVQIVGLSDVDTAHVQAFIDRHLSDYTPKPPIFTDAARMYADTKP